MRSKGRTMRAVWTVGAALFALGLPCLGAKPAKPLTEDEHIRLANELVNAVTKHDSERIASLLASGTDPNRSGNFSMSPVEFAVRDHDTLLLRKLLDAGGKPELMIPVRDFPGGVISLLFLSACHPQLAVSRILLERGANPKLEIRGLSLLSMAARCNQPAQYHFFEHRIGTPSPEARKRHADIAAAHGAWAMLEEFRKDSIVADPDSMISGLENAVADDDTSNVRRFLSVGTPVDHKGAHPESPLLLATRKGSKPIVRMLLDRNADVSFQGKQGRNSVMIAAEYRDTTILSWLLERDRNVGAVDAYARNAWYDASLQAMPLLARHKVPWDVNDRDGRSPLSYACANYQWDKARALLDLRGSRVDSSLDAQNALVLSLMRGNTEIAQRLFEAKAPLNLVPPSGPTPLQQALQEYSDAKRTRLTSWLLERGADPNLANAKGRTPFQTAVEESSWPSLARLISRGAKGDLASASYQVVVASAESGDDSLLKAVLAQGCDINGTKKASDRSRRANAFESRRDEETPLIHFIQAYKPEIVRKLLAYGANPNVRDTGSVPALLKAIRFYQIEMVQALLESGADVNAKDGRGQGWPEYLKEFPYDEMQSLLKSREAKP